MRHLLLIDPVERLNPDLDTSLALGRALGSLGEEVYMTTSQDLHWFSHQGVARCHARRLTFSQSTTVADPEVLGLDQFASIHMRKEPPFNLDYIACTLLLESVAESSSTRIYNQPAALRRYNEKLAIFEFPKFTRPALVSYRADELAAFWENEAQGDAILKPIDLYGGKSIRRINSKDFAKKKDLLALLREETGGGSQLRLIQPFEQAIFDGEVRAFAVGGQALAWCLKRPAAGQYLANTGNGATLHPYEPTPNELSMVQEVSQELLAKGLAVVGYDLIGGFISEINVTSPRLLTMPDAMAGCFAKFAEWVLGDLKS